MKTMLVKQRELFKALENCGEMVFACGPKGISVNLVGTFSIRQHNRGEDQLDVGDGTDHVHIDWSRPKRVEVGDFHGEGLLSFFDENELLFKLYRMAGPFPKSVSLLEGNLVD